MMEEKVFFSEKKNFLDNEALKLQGYEYENAATLGMDKEGFYTVIKAEDSWFKKKEIKEALKDAKEVKADEAKKVIKKFQELQDNAGAGIAMFG
jgi:hypothetical protein